MIPLELCSPAILALQLYANIHKLYLGVEKYMCKHLQGTIMSSEIPERGHRELDRFSASLRKWGGNTNTLRAPNWTSKPLFAEYSHYDYHVGHRFGLCNTKTLCFWWETGFTPKTHSEITSWVSSSHLGHFSISGFLIYVVWICQLLVSYFFTTALCNLSGWLEMTIQVKMQYFKFLFVPASLYHAKIYVSRPKMDVFAQFTGEKSIFFGLDCRISSYCIAWTLPSSIFINIWWTHLCWRVFLAITVLVFISNSHCESFLLSWIELDLLLLVQQAASLLHQTHQHL